MKKLTIFPKEKIEPFFEYYIVGLLRPSQIAALLGCNYRRVIDVFRNLKKIQTKAMIPRIQRNQEFYYSIFEKNINNNLDCSERYYKALLQIDDTFLDNLIKKLSLTNLPEVISEYFDFASPSYYKYYQENGKYNKLLLY